MAPFIFLDKLEFPRDIRRSETLLDDWRTLNKLPSVDRSVDAARKSACATKARITKAVITRARITEAVNHQGKNHQSGDYQGESPKQ